MIRGSEEPKPEFLGEISFSIFYSSVQRTTTEYTAANNKNQMHASMPDFLIPFLNDHFGVNRNGLCSL